MCCVSESVSFDRKGGNGRVLFGVANYVHCLLITRFFSYSHFLIILCSFVFTFLFLLREVVIFIDNNNNKFHIKTFRLVFSGFVCLNCCSLCASCFCIETFDFFISGLKCVRMCVGEFLFAAVVYVVILCR